jgi:hypothetical protein
MMCVHFICKVHYVNQCVMGGFCLSIWSPACFFYKTTQCSLTEFHIRFHTKNCKTIWIVFIQYIAYCAYNWNHIDFLRRSSYKIWLVLFKTFVHIARMQLNIRKNHICLCCYIATVDLCLHELISTVWGPFIRSVCYVNILCIKMLANITNLGALYMTDF